MVFLVFSIIPKNTAQAISGSVNSTGQITVTAAGAPFNAYVTPSGKRAVVQVTAIVETLTAAQNLRFRAAGVLIYQIGTGVTVLASTNPLVVSLGTFHLDELETIAVTTSNSGTEGGICRLNASVTSEIPRV